MNSEIKSSSCYNHDSPSSGPVHMSSLGGFGAFWTASWKTNL